MDKISRRSFIKSSMLAGGAFLYKPHKGLAENIMSSIQKNKKVFIFSKHLQWLDYAKMADTAKRIGFDGVDLTVRPNGHVLPENAQRDLPQAINAVRKSGLIIDTITTAITSVDSPDVETILKTASDNGIKQYRMGWIKYDSELSIDKNLEFILVQLEKLGELNATLGIRGDYQNHSGTSFGSSVWDLQQVLSKMKSEWIGSRYDIRHATVEGGVSWPVGLKALQPYIRSLDIKDFAWEQEGNKPRLVNRAIGEGWVDFKKYINLVNDLSIKGNFTMHFEYPLGGANKGQYKIDVPPETVIHAMKKDLITFKQYL
jgi:sugar phosphate isomerase/epimerase